MTTPNDFLTIIDTVKSVIETDRKVSEMTELFDTFPLTGSQIVQLLNVVFAEGEKAGRAFLLTQIANLGD